MSRDTYKYHFKLGNRIVHTGITNDLARREDQHRRASGLNGHIEQVGRRTTRAAALDWERRQRDREKPTEGYTVAMTPNPNGLVLVRKTNERSSTHPFALVWVLRCPWGTGCAPIAATLTSAAVRCVIRQLGRKSHECGAEAVPARPHGSPDSRLTGASDCGKGFRRAPRRYRSGVLDQLVLPDGLSRPAAGRRDGSRQVCRDRDEAPATAADWGEGPSVHRRPRRTSQAEQRLHVLRSNR